jgi:hypothetical protein
VIRTNLQGVADLVVSRAQRQGFIVPGEVREELTQAGLSDELWKDVLALARPALRCRRGRYYYSAPLSARMREEQSQRESVQRAVRQLLRGRQPAADSVERRGEARTEFMQQVQVTGEDGQVRTLLSRDLSATGIRLVGASRLLGQKVRVRLSGPDERSTCVFLVRILWTCAVGDGLFENGGAFLAVESEASVF